MPFILELYDNTNTTRQGQLSQIRDALAVFELEGENTLGFRLSIADHYFDSIVERKYIRLVNDQDATEYYSFIVQQINTIIDRDGDIFYEIGCEGLKYALMDFIIASSNEYFNITATQALTLITAAASGWSNGTIDPLSSNLATIKFDFINCLEAIQRIIDTWVYDDSGVQRHYFYKINEDKTIDIRELANIGTARNFYVHIDKNLRGFRRMSDMRGMANRVYAVGFEGFTIERAQKADFELDMIEATATGGAAAYLTDDNNIFVNDIWNGLLMTIVSGTGAGQKKTIIDVIGSVHRLYPDTSFSPAPDATSVYRVGHAENGENMTYTLGLGNTDDAAFDSKIIVNFLMDAVDNSGSAIFTVRVQALTAADAVVLQGSHREIMSDLSAENAIYGQIVLNVERNPSIRKILMECVSCNANGYVHFKKMTYSLAPNDLYVEDTNSQTTYGVIAGVYENPDIYDTLNLVLTPALDGTYSGGLCEDWTMVGSPTLTENTDADYVHHGTKSQKVVAAATGEGIRQNIVIERDTPYSAMVNVFIDPASAGSVELKIERMIGISWYDTASHIIAGAGEVLVTVENFSVDDAENIRVSVLSAGEASTFYVDAVMVHLGQEIHPFVDGDAVDLLYQEAVNYLKDNKDPIIDYELDLLDLYEKDPGIYINDNFAIGDQIRVVDADLSLDSQLLVIRKQFNPLDPMECQVRLARKPDWHRRSLGKLIVASIRENRLI